MHIDKYKLDNGYYKDEDGCHYEDAESFIATGILNLCGCGTMEESSKMVRDVLYMIDNRLKSDHYSLKLEEYFQGNEGLKFFTYHMLDNLELLEHGTIAPGWLTDKGKEVLSDLIEVYGRPE